MPPRPCWATKPWPLLQLPPLPRNSTPTPAHQIATSMAHTHNAILRGLNSIYLQSPYINTTANLNDKSDFLFFTKTWASWVTHHHKIEEEILFPGFERVTGVSGLMARDVRQHHGFERELQGLSKYVSEVTAEEVRGDEIRGRIEEFGERFRVHLEQEVEGLVGLGVYEEEQEELLGVYRKCEKEATRQDKWTIPPMVLGLRDTTADGSESWPGISPLLVWVVHRVLARKHSGAWRFLPCDTWGRPRELVFG